MSMRFPIAAGLLLVSAVWPAVAPAQQRARVAIESVQVGFPSPPGPGEADDERGRPALYKAGFWAPVFVRVTAGPDGVAGGQVLVETTDADDVRNTYAAPLPGGGLAPGSSQTLLAYVKTGSVTADLTVTIRADNQSADVKKTFEAIGPGDALVLTAGARLPGLRQFLASVANPQNSADRIREAFAGDVASLPNRWFGYGSADLVILPTGNATFLDDLLRDAAGRKEALAGWVRRGGRLVLSTGRNRDRLEELLGPRGLAMPAPITVGGPLPLTSLEGLQGWLGSGVPLLPGSSQRAEPSAGPVIEAGARLERRPGADLESIVPPREEDRLSPLVVRWAFGSGQVILVAFDLDGSPFSQWAGQPDFWRKLLARTGPRLGDSRAADRSQAEAGRGQDVAGQLQRNLDQFKDVAVVSFGWVALFILIYIVVVGPLDYLFLRKVVKRLELTWVTFPVVVLVASAAACGAAYSLKGGELKINKVDLVDIDPVQGRVHGTAWFSVFSPRSELYTIGIEPAAPVWAVDPAGGDPPGPVTVSWLGRPEESYGGYDRPRSQSLFRRGYAYGPDAAGLRDVPIPVWSSKAFAADWERPFRSKQPASRLRRRQNALGIEGTVTNPLPVALEDAVLVYGEVGTESQGKVYLLGPVGPGQTRPLIASGRTTNLSQWLLASPLGPPGEMLAAGSLMTRIMFHDAYAGQDGLRDRALRPLDQSWRRFLKAEAILVGRLPRLEGSAADVSQDPASPTRLWLGRLPAPGEAPPALPGRLAQETYVRVYLPVAPAPAP